MTRSRPIRIDDDLCTGCGRCISVCPKEILSLCKGKVVPVDQQRCMLCGHCVGACPTGALFLPELDEDASAYETIPDPTGWTGFGEYDICGLVRLMRSRRSCRNYSPRPVEEELLSDLVKIGVTAPSGTNSQKWTFTIIPQREQVLDLGESIAGFFRKLNRAAANPLIRTGLRL
ncbi:MAG: 4Fe-4S binding protein, partial [Desulfovibrionales bacterium]